MPLRTLPRNKGYPNQTILNAFCNAKLQGPAPKPKDNFSDVPFVTIFHKDAYNKIIMTNTYNKIIMTNTKRKRKNISSDYLEIFRETNIFLSQRDNVLSLRSSRSQMLFKVDALKNFANFTGKYLCWSLFLIKFIKKRLQLRYFPAKFMKFLRKPFSQNTSGGFFWRLISNCHFPKSRLT